MSTAASGASAGAPASAPFAPPPPSSILVIVGSRPEAIKLAPLVLAMRRRPDRFEVRVCATGQQREMAPRALADFGLTADVDLGVMRPDQTLAGLTARLLDALDALIVERTPDWVVVQGDTTSAMAGALAGFYRRVRVAHVEAGLRTGDPASPFPEEVNRRVIAQCATLHFAPTARCRRALLREGVAPACVRLTGNTVVDALHWMRAHLPGDGATLPAEVAERAAGRRVVLVTTHRRESFGDGMRRTCAAVREIARRAPDVVVVLPVHPNPNVTGPVREALAGVPNVVLTEPLAYPALVALLDRCALVLTDSGGIQEEAPSFGKPVLVLRDTTERPEGVRAGVARLVGTDPGAIVGAALELLEQPAAYERMARSVNPYGDGRAAVRIAAALRRPAARAIAAGV